MSTSARREVNTVIRVGVTKNSLWYVALDLNSDLNIIKIYQNIWSAKNISIFYWPMTYHSAFGLRSLISQLFRLKLMKPQMNSGNFSKWCSTWNAIGWDSINPKARTTRMTSPSKALQFCCWTCAKCLEELHALLLTRRLEIQKCIEFKAPKASCWKKNGNMMEHGNMMLHAHAQHRAAF